MERHQNPQARTAGTERESRSRRIPSRAPARDRLETAGLTARLALEGVPLREMPPGNLEELASAVGNSAMVSLLEAQAPRAEEVSFRMPGETPGLVPVEVPAEASADLADPGDLTGIPVPDAAFDAAAWTAQEGGGPHGPGI